MRPQERRIQMKRIIAVGLTLLMLLGVTACGSSENGGGVSKKDSLPLALDQKVSIEDHVEFKLVKIQSTDKIEASMDSFLYYSVQSPDEIYVDVILDITNIGTEGIGTEEIASVSAKGASGTDYFCSLYAVETDANTSLSQYEVLAPLTSARLHCGIPVSKAETSVKISLNVKGTTYFYEYLMGTPVANFQPLVAGQKIEKANFAEAEFRGIEYADALYPSNTSGYYSYYNVDNADNTYLIVGFNMTNYQSIAKDCETFVSAKAVYMDTYTYSGFAVVEDSDGAGFSTYEEIAPLTTRNLCLLIEVPKAVSNNPVKLYVNFGGVEYLFTNA